MRNSQANFNLFFFSILAALLRNQSQCETGFEY